MIEEENSEREDEIDDEQIDEEIMKELDALDEEIGVTDENGQLETEEERLEKEEDELFEREGEDEQLEIEEEEQLETEEDELSEREREEEKSEFEALDDAAREKIHKKNIVEAALFVAGRAISVEELSTKTEIGKKELQEILDELILDYLERPTALEIVAIHDKYSLQIRPEYTPKVKKFASGGLIPDAILKTLTIIALKQPILKSTLVKLRGSGAYEHVKFLLDRDYITGKKKGRSVELMTTDQFADTFGLSRDIKTLKKQLITQLGVKEE